MNNPAASFLATLAWLLSGSYAVAQTTSPVPADNAKSNQVEASNAKATADSQTNNPADIALAKRIRQNLVADKSLSTYAHNVKIVSVNGSVTLNGVVRSADEKNVVEMKVADIAGKNNVTDDLKIAPSK
jgi:hyperosmotically inducible periplasmic protein